MIIGVRIRSQSRIGCFPARPPRSNYHTSDSSSFIAVGTFGPGANARGWEKRAFQQIGSAGQMRLLCPETTVVRGARSLLTAAANPTHPGAQLYEGGDSKKVERS
jgi:hypothetical protein